MSTDIENSEDYVLVPRKPTKAMLKAGWYGAHEEDAEETWRLMLEEYELQKRGSSLLAAGNRY